jgi:CDP-diacylglycerol--glycerol-3-phosphate 3-phosphatidyltransferase
MTPRVQHFPIFIGFAGVAAITALANSLPSYEPALASSTFLAGALGTWLVLLISLTIARGEHSRASAGGARGAPLTPATWITIARGMLVSLVGGFAPGPAPAGAARWAPCVLYAVAALGDGADGALARRTGRTSALGAALDVRTDVVGLIVAPLCAVRWGRLPPWYFALALAYPAFRAALALRRARGLPVFVERLRPDPRARFFAGVQMAVVAAALSPVLPRALTWPVATLAMLPTLALFAGEWRTATRLQADGDARAERLHA